MKSKVKKTGGDFNPLEKHLYFVASNARNLSYAEAVTDNMLIAVNEIGSDAAEEWVRHIVRVPGKRLFIDSGVFNLAMEHARAHEVPMDVALSVAPDEIDGFDELFARYTRILREVGDRAWGYIEIDQGGRDNKIKTRKRLEDLGLKPIPVYHPLNDGWDYFDYLASRYDRICFGNVVQAEPDVRKRLIATMWQRKQKYPKLWIHLLGVSPYNIMFSFPSNSADSSSWLTHVRYANMVDFAMLQPIMKLGLHFNYKLRSEPLSEAGYIKASTLGAYSSVFMQNDWNHYLNRLSEEGL